MEGRDDECSAVGGTRAWRTRAAQVLAAVLARQLLREFCHSSHVKRINYAHPTLNSLEASFAYLPSLPRSRLSLFLAAWSWLWAFCSSDLRVICRVCTRPSSCFIIVKLCHRPLLTIAHQLSNPCYACCMTQSPRPVSVRFDFPLRPTFVKGSPLKYTTSRRHYNHPQNNDNHRRHSQHHQ